MAREKTREKSAGNGGSSKAQDARLRAMIGRVAAKLCKDGKPLRVEIDDGFVVLTGSVQTHRQRERLHKFVMGLHGVRALKDLLRIEPNESVHDEQVALHIRQALDAHSELPPGTAVVHVHNGVATLKGHVCSAEECYMAENIASHCRGVKKVINEITVDPLDEVSDEATARAVRGALAYCDEFETDGVTVSCADGHVCLRGEVPSIMDRTLAEEISRIQFGVRSVENHIVVRTVRYGRRKTDRMVNTVERKTRMLRRN